MSQKARFRNKWAAFTIVALEDWGCTLRMGVLLLVEAVCTLGPPLLLAWLLARYGHAAEVIHRVVVCLQNQRTQKLCGMLPLLFEKPGLCQRPLMPQTARRRSVESGRP